MAPSHSQVPCSPCTGWATARCNLPALKFLALRATLTPPLPSCAESIGRGLKVPVVSKSAEEAAAHFGFLGMFVSRDLIASSGQTQRRLGWRPTGPGLIADLDGTNYFEQTAHAAR